MEGLICSIIVERNEFGELEVVVRDSGGLEHRDPLSCEHLDADRVWYALLHDCII